MRVLLTGATGLIGGHLLQRLADAGHAVLCAGRRAPPALPPGCRWVAIDPGRATTADWLPHMTGVQAVINAVGIFRETAQARFQALHVDGPAALFGACVRAGVGRVLHLSALGADAAANTEYHRSKYAGDQALLQLPLQACVLQPSLVFDPQGTSSAALLGMAALPLLVLPDGGQHRVQPIHIDDLSEAVLQLLAAPGPQPQRLAAVGPQDLALHDYLQQLRAGMGLGRAPLLALPPWLSNLAAAVGERLPGALFDRAALAMLRRGNVAPATTITALLGRPPRPVARFIDARSAPGLRQGAAWRWLQPVLRVALAFLWLWTAAVSLWFYPVADSLSLLARAGVPKLWQLPALWGAAGLDLLLGLATLWPGRWGRGLWAAQAALILGYSAVITLRLPEYWWHPYGPLSKNVPILALLLLLWVMDGPRKPPRAASVRP